MNGVKNIDADVEASILVYSKYKIKGINDHLNKTKSNYEVGIELEHVISLTHHYELLMFLLQHRYQESGNVLNF